MHARPYGLVSCCALTDTIPEVGGFLHLWPGLSCCLPVLVDEPGEPGTAPDPGGRDGEGVGIRVVVRSAQGHAVALVPAAGVVVTDVLG